MNKKLLNSLLILGLLSCLSGCKNANTDTKVVEPIIDVEPTINVNKDKLPVSPTLTLNNAIKIGIKGSSEVKSNGSITLKANVTNYISDASVTWSVKGEGANKCSIDQNGKLTASEVTTTTNVEVVATSNENPNISTSKVVSILSRPVLTQAMLDVLNVDKLVFDGYLNIDLYTIKNSTLYYTYNTQVRTAMDGTNWYASYEDGNSGAKSRIFYKNINNKACQVGVSFTNEDSYVPLLDDNNQEVSFIDSGLYNSLKNLSVSDFSFNNETWRYEYKGLDNKRIQRVIASANPYDFEADNFSLIMDDEEILGIYSKSKDDYSLVENYKAVMEMIVAIDTSENVTIPTISKYTHEPIHDKLAEAITNMHNLESYTIDSRSTQGSIYTSTYTQSGYIEKIDVNQEAQFTPYTVKYIENVANEILDEEYFYGFKKINDNLYNSYYADSNNSWNLKANRAYEKDFTTCLPTFDFAAEIFRSYVENEDGSTTYYVDEIMNQVATTFYYDMGTDNNLYGIYATTGSTGTGTFTPYVTVKDGYIVDSGFYYYLGYIYGMLEYTYSDFNTTTLTKDTSFTVRQLPASYDDITIYVSDELASTTEDVETNAKDVLIDKFGLETYNNIPFFGTSDLLGDSFGWGLNTIRIPKGESVGRNSIVLYYDVPLDIDYSIESSLRVVRNYLVEQGFTRTENDVFIKDNLYIEPVDSSLDYYIYIWTE